MKENEMGGAYDIWSRREIHAGFWWGNLKERTSW